jgi:hypothetical protein
MRSCKNSSTLPGIYEKNVYLITKPCAWRPSYNHAGRAALAYGLESIPRDSPEQLCIIVFLFSCFRLSSVNNLLSQLNETAEHPPLTVKKRISCTARVLGLGREEVVTASVFTWWCVAVCAPLASYLIFIKHVNELSHRRPISTPNPTRIKSLCALI